MPHEIKIIRQVPDTEVAPDGRTIEMVRVEYQVGPDGPFPLRFPRKAGAEEIIAGVEEDARKRVAVRERFGG